MKDFQSKEGRLNDDNVIDRFKPAPLSSRILVVALVMGLVLLIFMVGGSDWWIK